MLRIKVRAGSAEIAVEVEADLLQSQRLEIIERVLDCEPSPGMAEKLKADIDSGKLDSTIAQNYGIRRTGRL